MAGPGKTENLTNAGKGRKPGVPNKATKLLKDMILEALDNQGGAKYLERVAVEEPTAFCTLLGKVLPTQITGEGGGPVMIVTGVPREADAAD